MLNYRKHVETTAPKCKKSLSALKARLQRVLNNATSSNCIKVWWRGNASHTGNHQGHTHWDHEVHARPPTNTNQTSSWAGQSTCQYRRKSPQPTPGSRERHRGMQTGTRQVLDGSSRGLSTVSMPADRAQANQGVGKLPKPIPASLRDTTARMSSRQNSQRSSFSFKKTANGKTL